MEYVVSHPDVDLEYLHFMCTHELILTEALTEHIDLPLNILNSLRELCQIVRCQMQNEQTFPHVELETTRGNGATQNQHSAGEVTVFARHQSISPMHSKTSGGQ